MPVETLQDAKVRNSECIRVIEQKESSEYYRYVFGYGHKEMTLTVHPDTGQCKTYIENVSGEEDRIDGETTALYAAAKERMQAIANETQRSFRYAFVTQYDHLRSWAETSGRELFDWHFMKYYPEYAQYECVTIIAPKSDEIDLSDQ